MPNVRARDADKLQGRIERLLARLVDGGWELGVQAAVYLDGEPVAEVCVGHADAGRTRPVTPDTVFPVCSTGKGILATLVHILAERGLIAYDRPLADYWPAFAAHGKGTVLVRHALAHQAGLQPVPAFASLAEACDFDAACARMAEQPLSGEPGALMQYHSRTFGWIVGGLVRQVAGRPLGEVLRAEIAAPLGLAGELFFGIDETAAARLAPFVAQPAQQAQITTAPATAAPPPPGSASELALPLMDFVNLPTVQRCCMPAVNGIMSARAIARHYAALVSTVDGVRLLPPARVVEATALATDPSTTPACFGHGYGLGWCLKGPAGDPGATFGHGGAGGSEGLANRALGLAIGLAKNRMDTHVDAPGHTNRLLVQEVLATLGHAGDGGFFTDR